MDPSELIPMDKTYKERIALRQRLLEQHHDIVVAVNESPTADTRTRAAVSELYNFVLGVYLPSRYPSMFKLHENTFENLITGGKWPTSITSDTPTIRALEILAQTTDEEFLILIPDISSEPENPKYILQAYATCFPSGFNTREKLGLRLADIHGPVPGYAEKLERSMDRFFAKIEVGRFVRRVNWSVTTEADLFAAFGSVHASQDPEDAQDIVEKAGTGEQALKAEELDLDQVWLQVKAGLFVDGTDYSRLSCGVSVRRFIGCLDRRPWCLRFILIPILFGRSKTRDLERSWPWLLMDWVVGMCQLCMLIREGITGERQSRLFYDRDLVTALELYTIGLAITEQ